MDEKEVNEIKNVIADLDKRVTRDDAAVRFIMYGGGPDESYVQANQKGYLRLGIEFLKASFAPLKKDNKKVLDVDIGYLSNEEDEISFDWLERSENLKLLPEPKGSIIPPVFGVIVFLVIIFFLIMGILGIKATFF